MKLLYLSFVVLVAMAFTGNVDNSLSSEEKSPCGRNCAAEGQELFDRLYVDQGLEYLEARDQMRAWIEDCYERC